MDRKGRFFLLDPHNYAFFGPPKNSFAKVGRVGFQLFSDITYSAGAIAKIVSFYVLLGSCFGDDELIKRAGGEGLSRDGS